MLDPESDVDQRPAAQELLAKLRSALPDLKALLEKCCSHWGYEDPVYRFYHHSFKVFHLQATTLEIVTALEALAPGRALNKQFTRIVRGGTGKTFEYKHNAVWLRFAPHVLERRLPDGEARGVQQAPESAVVSVGPLAIDHGPDLLGERSLVAGRLGQQVAESLGHGGELEIEQLLDGFFVGHDGSVSFRS